MGFSRQEYWSGLPFASLGDLPNPGIESGSPALQADSLPSEQPETWVLRFRSGVEDKRPHEELKSKPHDLLGACLVTKAVSFSQSWSLYFLVASEAQSRRVTCRIKQ